MPEETKGRITTLLSCREEKQKRRPGHSGRRYTSPLFSSPLPHTPPPLFPLSFPTPNYHLLSSLPFTHTPLLPPSSHTHTPLFSSPSPSHTHISPPSPHTHTTAPSSLPHTHTHTQVSSLHFELAHQRVQLQGKLAEGESTIRKLKEEAEERVSS